MRPLPLAMAALLALPAMPTSAIADELPITFESAELGAPTDPTGLWSDQEIEEGGSVVQPSIHHATFPVDGGEVTLAILVDHWCSLSECPYRVRLRAPSLGVDLGGEGMICQAFETFNYDPVALTIKACAQTIDLKELMP